MKRSSWPAFLLFAAAALPVPHGRSDDRFSASAAPLNPVRRPTFSVPAEPGYYYQLRRSPSPTGPWSVTAMAKGINGPLSLTDSIPALDRAFFSIRRVPLTSPLDTDGDGLSDTSEWNASNPTNPFHSGRFINAADGRSAMATLADYNALAHFDNFPGAPSVQEVKFLILNAHTAQPQLFFLNAAKHQYHYYFARDVLGYAGSLSQFNGETYFSNTTRRNLAGSLVHHRNYLPPDGSPQGLITMEFWPSDAVSHSFVQKAYDLITRSAANTGVRFAYHAASETQRTLFRSERTLFTEAARHSLHTVRTEDLFGQTPYTLLNPGVGFGRLILFDGSSSVSPTTSPTSQASSPRSPRRLSPTSISKPNRTTLLTPSSATPHATRVSPRSSANTSATKPPPKATSSAKPPPKRSNPTSNPSARPTPRSPSAISPSPPSARSRPSPSPTPAPSVPKPPTSPNSAASHGPPMSPYPTATASRSTSMTNS